LPAEVTVKLLPYFKLVGFITIVLVLFLNPPPSITQSPIYPALAVIVPETATPEAYKVPSFFTANF
jgi:hypothetical protein